jgi:phosphatidylinositol kinase/protein kinase (PI-3  family)
LGGFNLYIFVKCDKFGENLHGQQRFVEKIREIAKSHQINEPTVVINEEFTPVVPFILDSSVMISKIDLTKTYIFPSKLNPFKFVAKTAQNEDFTAIYKSGDDLRMDQLVMQMLALSNSVIFLE